MKNSFKTAFLASLFCVVSAAGLYAQTTEFTYQGRLTENGVPVSGAYDFEFRLYDDGNFGSQLGSTFVADDVAVTGGLFTVLLDFGTAFNGPDRDRYLNIFVRPGSSTGGYTSLRPRQRITATPYALKAMEATMVPANTITSSMLADGAVTASKIAEGAVSGLGTPDGLDTSVVTVDDDGLVGIGTDNPSAGLHITGGREIQSLELLSFVEDETDGYTNLRGVRMLAVEGDLLAAAAYSDSAFTLVNIADPSNPVRLAQIKDGDGAFIDLLGAYGLALSGDLLAVAAQLDDAVTLIDVSNPAVPAHHSVIRDGVGGFNDLDRVSGVAIEGSLMAVAAEFEDAVTLVDVSNPAVPILRAVLKDGTFGFDELFGAFQVAMQGNLLAIAARFDNAVTLVDVSNPSSPVLLAVMKDGVDGFGDLGNPYQVAIQGNLLAIAARDDAAVTLVDITNPAAPVLRAVMKDGVGGFDGLNGAGGVAFSGSDLAITALHDSAVTLVDVSDPAAPAIRGLAHQHRAGIHGLEGAQGIVYQGSDILVGGGFSDSVSMLRPTARNVSLASGQWVGIGTTQPLAPLHVKGNVIVENAEEINLAATHFSTGGNTEATGESATAMGWGTTASGDFSTAMNRLTTASGIDSTAIGWNTTASGSHSTAMGYFTTASGDYSMAMGQNSQAISSHTFAAGREANANHSGSFVWSDGSGAATFSAAQNSVTIRAQGGFRFLTGTGTTGAQLTAGATSWSVLSDRNRKKDIQPLDGRGVLDKLVEVPISTWHYDFESGDGTPHIGPMAQDFKAAFYPGRDDTRISTLEADGVALAAIQGLNQKLEDRLHQKDGEIADLKQELAELKTLVNRLGLSVSNVAREAVPAGMEPGE